jgi:hypothetical protein
VSHWFQVSEVCASQIAQYVPLVSGTPSPRGLHQRKWGTIGIGGATRNRYIVLGTPFLTWTNCMLGCRGKEGGGGANGGAPVSTKSSLAGGHHATMARRGKNSNGWLQTEWTAPMGNPRPRTRVKLHLKTANPIKCAFAACGTASREKTKKTCLVVMSASPDLADLNSKWKVHCPLCLG